MFSSNFGLAFCSLVCERATHTFPFDDDEPCLSYFVRLTNSFTVRYCLHS